MTSFMFSNTSNKYPVTKRRSISQKKKKGQNINDESIQQIEEALKLLVQYKQTLKINHTPTWAEIFYNYMTSLQTPIPEKMDFLKKDLIIHCQTLLKDYLEWMSYDKETAVENTLTETAQTLEQFFNHHKVDPYSCMIGLTPTKDVLELAKSEKDTSKNTQERTRTITSAHTTPSNSSSLLTELANHPTSLSSETHSREELQRKILQWALIDDPHTLQIDVREFAGELRGVKSLEAGVLVLVEIEHEKMVYARYARNSTQNLIEVYTHPHEHKLERIRIHKIFPLAAVTLKRIQEASISELEKLILSPAHAIYQDLIGAAGTKSYDFVSSYGIDLEVVRLANNNSCSISLLHKLKNAEGKIMEWAQNPPETLINELQARLNTHIEEFKKLIGTVQLYRPTSVLTLTQLTEFDVKSVLVGQFRRLVGICTGGLDQLKLDKRDLMAGTRKVELSDWWLGEVDSALLHFLQKLGYDTNAVPENYVEQAPKDLSAVERNLAVLDHLLNTDKQKTGLQALIDKLKNLIYPKIEAFITDAKIALCEQFGMDLTTVGKDFDLQKVEEAFEKNKTSIDAKERDWIDEMIKDIKYLDEMVRLEDPTYAQAKGQAMSHIVPVSGLVITSLIRAQNECKTTTELWELMPEEIGETAGQTLLHRAVIANDIPAIVDLLQTSIDDINKQDANGYTPVHYCASSHSPTSLEICSKLTSNGVWKPDLLTNKGNSVLHYLANFPMDDSTRKPLLETIRNLSSKADLNLRNHDGETCLHVACLANHADVVKLLIGCSASTHIRNNENESSLFVAVRGGNVEAVKALLETYMVDLSEKVHNKTPLDLARSMNHAELVSILSGGKTTLNNDHSTNNSNNNNNNNNNSNNSDSSNSYNQSDNMRAKSVDDLARKAVNPSANVGVFSPGRRSDMLRTESESAADDLLKEVSAFEAATAHKPKTRESFLSRRQSVSATVGMVVSQEEKEWASSKVARNSASGSDNDASGPNTPTKPRQSGFLANYRHA